MSRVLVTYATKHGATTEIAQAIADELRHAGHETDCLQVDHIDTFDGYDAAVVGRASYIKRWRPEARRALKRHGKALAERPFWIFSSGPCGQKPDPSWSKPRRRSHGPNDGRTRTRRVRRTIANRAEQLHGALDGRRLSGREP